MATIKYIGRTNDFRGKTLWEIVGNLKDFGIGRVVVRSMFERYPEKSFMRILKVQALPNEDIRKVRVTVEKTFRGRTLPRPIEICSTSYKADYRLVPKAEEADYCKVLPVIQMKILPRTMDFPPLLKEFIVNETGNANPTLPVKIHLRLNKLARLAEEGEQPNVELPMGLGTPASPGLYEHVKL